jgi:Ni,Fe-hydrogenase III component G
VLTRRSAKAILPVFSIAIVVLFPWDIEAPDFAPVPVLDMAIVAYVATDFVIILKYALDAPSPGIPSVSRIFPVP